MSTSNPLLEDPLTAALPPNTDYITYLTILEYQLTPKNLPTLNRLLQEDDGKLASEIGWDLLKLVLPILRVEPSSAKECLDIISRRGNPREVIVRVSEELETLGVDDTEQDDDANANESDDGLPTFVGEAPRVHLGDMTLAGMPQVEKTQPSSKLQHEIHENEEQQETHTLDATVDELKLQSLLSMLSLLHPRIKTKYPSRFLATSLPAALGAYRRLTMNADSTSAFLETLTKLSGNARPILPPRIPTADLLRKTTTVSSVPLPDPEAIKEGKDEESQAISDNESAINRRLLQAVLLEVIEEHTTASSEAQPPLTARLRSKYEPDSITSARRQELDNLTSNNEAISADSRRRKFLAVGKILKLDVQAELTKSLQPPINNPEDEEEHEYPTSPAQIPFSATGLLLLYSSLSFIQAMSESSQAVTVSTDDTLAILEIINNQYTSDFRLRQSGPALDCVLSLLYTTICQGSTLSVATTEPPTKDLEGALVATFATLKDIFTTCPDSDLRDNACHISSHLIHAHLKPLTRVAVFQELLTTSESTQSNPSPVQEAQVGNLKALAVTWLKDEIYPTQSILTIMQRLADTGARGLPPSSLVELADHIFPSDSIPASPNSNTTNKSERQSNEEAALEVFASSLPFYISALNLLTIQIKNYDQGTGAVTTTVSAPLDQPTTSSQTQTNPLLPKTTQYVAKLHAWSTYLTSQLSELANTQTGKTSEGEDQNRGIIDVDGISIPDIYALEDAIGRVKQALEEHAEAEVETVETQGKEAGQAT